MRLNYGVMIVVGVLMSGVVSFAEAADWPQFLGPDRSSVSPETGLIDQFEGGQAAIRWSVDIGPGFGGASVVDGEVYLLDRVMNEADVLRVFDAKSGKELWSYRYEAEGRLSKHGSRSTPTVDDQHVYTVGGFGDLYCFSRKTHKPVWHVNLADKYSRGQLKWGFAQSPMLYKDTVIVTPTHPQSPGLVALDKHTGEVVWEAEAFGGDYYASPIMRTVAGRQGVLQIANKAVYFINPDNGKTIWKYEGYDDCNWPIPAPTVLPDGERIFITGGYDAGSVMIRVTGDGSDYKIEELFRHKSGAQIHPAIFIDGYLYANINENTTLRRSTMKDGGLACINPNTGKIAWRTGEDPNFGRGGVLFADGKLIVLDGQNGNLYLVKPDPDRYIELSRAKVFDLKRDRGNDIWAPLALSDGLLIIRNQSQLQCVDMK